MEIELSEAQIDTMLKVLNDYNVYTITDSNKYTDEDRRNLDHVVDTLEDAKQILPYYFKQP